MPSIYVFDCSNAALILDKFTEFQQNRDVKMEVSEGVRLLSTLICDRLEMMPWTINITLVLCQLLDKS